MTRPGRYRLAHAAEVDFEAILACTAEKFGPLQRRRYARLIIAAAEAVGDQPMRPGSRDRSTFQPHLRSYHVGLSAPRRDAASHLLFYRAEQGGVLILRILHQTMDFAAHLGVHDGP